MVRILQQSTLGWNFNPQLSSYWQQSCFHAFSRHASYHSFPWKQLLERGGVVANFQLVLHKEEHLSASEPFSSLSWFYILN